MRVARVDAATRDMVRAATMPPERRFGPFDLSEPQLSADPFPFFGKTEFMQPDVGAALLTWLEAPEQRKWKDHGGAYYQLQDFSLLKADLPPELECLRATESREWLRAQMAEIFATPLGDQVDLDAHRMIAADKVGVHTDYRPGKETHRLVFFVGHDWTDEHGGVLLFFDAPPRSPQIGFPPLHLLAIGFEI